MQIVPHTRELAVTIETAGSIVIAAEGIVKIWVVNSSVVIRVDKCREGNVIFIFWHLNILLVLELFSCNRENLFFPSSIPQCCYCQPKPLRRTAVSVKKWIECKCRQFLMGVFKTLIVSLGIK